MDVDNLVGSFGELLEQLFGAAETCSLDEECQDCECVCVGWDDVGEETEDEWDEESGIPLDEEWREYLFSAGDDITSEYHISEPVFLYFLPDEDFHAVEDSEGVIHIVPAPGTRGCVVRFKPN